ncbi:purine-cytosine permease family protein [Halomonas sp. S2151]|uniref:purine-cytosine permease family protein n=1 Tax=Halomonas sp. S2151 TaxID=579478 RepID=UPI0005FA2B9A|nr:membrane protein [Halomonas sp. S2151]
MATSGFDPQQSLDSVDDEQLPVPPHKQHGAKHFLGLYAAEHVAATEFVIGATFVGLGAGIWDILIGLVIGNTLAILSFTLITAPIAVGTRLSLFAYLERIAGNVMAKLNNGANVVIFAAISAAMITVSATAVRVLFDVPPQVAPYPTDMAFVIIAFAVGAIVVLVAAFGFNALSEFASICAPWLMVMFTAGGMVLIPALSESVTGFTTLTSFSDFVAIASASVFTGINADGEPGIGLWEVIGFAWAANTFAHFGLIDMALLRYARKKRYALATSTGMMFGHYVAWISAGLMGAATAATMKLSILVVDPGDVAFYALGMSGFVIVIVAGWTTANSNLYRAGLAAQALMPEVKRWKVTMLVGLGVMGASCFPFVYRSMLPLLTYAGLILVPVGGIAFAEYQLFPRLGMTRYWANFKGLADNRPAIASWGISLIFGFGLNVLDVMPFYYLFLPTWFVSILVYVVLARRAGACEAYPEKEKAQQEFNERVVEHHRRKAAEKYREGVEDKTLLSKGIKVMWGIVGLGVPAVLAWRVMFESPDLYQYYVNRELFYDITIWCTVIYFVFAYWGLQRSKQFKRREPEGTPSQASTG